VRRVRPPQHLEWGAQALRPEDVPFAVGCLHRSLCRSLPVLARASGSGPWRRKSPRGPLRRPAPYKHEPYTHPPEVEYMAFVDDVLKFLNRFGREVIPIIGTPGSGKTFFLASLTKWVLDQIEEPEQVFREGREYLYDLNVRFSSTELDPRTRTTTVKLIAPTVPTGDKKDLQHNTVLLRIPKMPGLAIPRPFDLFTIDGPGEILISNPEILDHITQDLRGLILLVDLVGDDPTASSINWANVTNNAVNSTVGLGRVLSEKMQPETPVALVVTKWDRILTLDGFRTEEQRRPNWERISKRLINTYMPLVRQHRAKVLVHSSVGPYSTFDDALNHKQQVFPYPIGTDEILRHIVSNAK
jgi:hypothetical protein